MRSPYSRLRPHAISVFLSLLTWLFTLALKDTSSHYLWSLVNERGPFPYASIYFGYLNAIVIFMIGRAPGEGLAQTLSVVLFSEAPLLFGLTGTIAGLYGVGRGAYDVFTGACLYSITDVAEGIRSGLRSAWDPTILGGTITAVNYAHWSIHRLMKK